MGVKTFLKHKKDIVVCILASFPRFWRNTIHSAEKNDTSYENQGFCHWKKTKQKHFFGKKNQNGLIKESHVGWATPMPFASINSTSPSPIHFQEKILRIGGAGKWAFFLSAILNFVFQNFFFVFFQWQKPWFSYELSFFSALWMVSPESWKRGCPN